MARVNRILITARGKFSPKVRVSGLLSPHRGGAYEAFWFFHTGGFRTAGSRGRTVEGDEPDRQRVVRDPNEGTGYDIIANGGVPGWNDTCCTGDGIEIDYSPVIGGPAYDGSQSMEVDANTFDTVSQTVNGLTVGQQYTLFWAYGDRPGSGPQELEVYFGGSLVTTDYDLAATNSSLVWFPQSFTVTATSTSEVLSFAAVNVGGLESYGNEIDGVSLNAVPEPGTLPSSSPACLAYWPTVGEGGLCSGTVGPLERRLVAMIEWATGGLAVAAVGGGFRMSLPGRFYWMMRLDGGAGRWIYLPYAVVLTVELILSVGEAPLAMVWYYWVPIPFFVIQFVWPTVIGWAGCDCGLVLM